MQFIVLNYNKYFIGSTDVTEYCKYNYTNYIYFFYGVHIIIAIWEFDVSRFRMVVGLF
jgi:hypothetical protein